MHISRTAAMRLTRKPLSTAEIVNKERIPYIWWNYGERTSSKLNGVNEISIGWCIN